LGVYRLPRDEELWYVRFRYAASLHQAVEGSSKVALQKVSKLSPYSYYRCF
jgi:hypothetical protein